MSDSIHLECVENGASKFWSGSVTGNVLTIRWGRIGTRGQSKAQSFPSKESAVVSLEKQAAEKLKKGYATNHNSGAQSKILNAAIPKPKSNKIKNNKIFSIWKTKKIDPEVLSEILDNDTAKSVRKIGSVRSKQLDEAIDSISDGVLNLSEAVGTLSISDIVYLFFHSKMKKIKEIRSNKWCKYDFETISVLPAYQRAKDFLGVFPPAEVFQLDEFYSAVLPACLSFRISAEFDGFQELRGIFGKAIERRDLKGKDVLSARYILAPLNYIPTFYYGSDSVTQGFVFDLQESRFSRGVGWQDYEFTCESNLWDKILESLARGFEMSAETLLYVDYVHASSDPFKSLDAGFKEAETPLQLWAIALCLAGFLNFCEIQRKSENSDRYDLDYELIGSMESESFVVISSIYPRCIISLKENFFPGILKKDLESLFEAASIGAKAVDKCLKECKSFPRKITDSSQKFDEKIRLKRLIDFALEESRDDRSWLAIGLMFGLWNSMGKEETEWASHLAAGLKTGAVPKFVRDVAIMHGKSRFNPKIVV